MMIMNRNIFIYGKKIFKAIDKINSLRNERVLFFKKKEFL